MTSVTPRPTPAQSKILKSPLGAAELLRRRRGKPVLLFDIDDTLLSTANRHLRILGEFAAQRRLKLRGLSPKGIRYSITDTAREAGLRDEATLQELRDYWFGKFFDNAYLLEDRPIPGAPAYCQEALFRGARLVYLTGRDEGMRPGTLKSLAENGFPAPEGDAVHLLLKPSFDTPDHEFKGAALRRVAGLGTLVASFENEPAHANLFREAFPAAAAILLETRHSGRAVELRAEIRRVKNFLY